MIFGSVEFWPNPRKIWVLVIFPVGFVLALFMLCNILKLILCSTAKIAEPLLRNWTNMPPSLIPFHILAPSTSADFQLEKKTPKVESASFVNVSIGPCKPPTKIGTLWTFAIIANQLKLREWSIMWEKIKVAWLDQSTKVTMFRTLGPFIMITQIVQTVHITEI